MLLISLYRKMDAVQLGWNRLNTRRISKKGGGHSHRDLRALIPRIVIGESGYLAILSLSMVSKPLLTLVAPLNGGIGACFRWMVAYNWCSMFCRFSMVQDFGISPYLMPTCGECSDGENIVSLIP